MAYRKNTYTNCNTQDPGMGGEENGLRVGSQGRGNVSSVNKRPISHIDDDVFLLSFFFFGLFFFLGGRRVPLGDGHVI